MAKTQSFLDPDEQNAKDYDPEGQAPDSDNHSSGDDISDEERLATEHYVSVGQSKLRGKRGVSLGRAYRGSRVSRSALEDESDQSSSDGNDESDEEESDEMENESLAGSTDDSQHADPDSANNAVNGVRPVNSKATADEAIPKAHAERRSISKFGDGFKAKTLESQDAEASFSDFSPPSSDEDSDIGGALIDEEDNSSRYSRDVSPRITPEGSAKMGLRASKEAYSALNPSQAASDDEGSSQGSASRYSNGLTRSPALSTAKQSAKPPPAHGHSNQVEVEKGLAVQKQRTVYDGLLNLRIRLQKALVAVNTLPLVEASGVDAAEAEAEAYEAAEEAAFKLLDTMSRLRETLQPQGSIAGQKCKRGLERGMSSEAVWAQILEEQQMAVPFREERLEKWSRKVESVSATAWRGLAPAALSLVQLLREQLSRSEERFVKRTRIPRSCAPVQAARQSGEDEGIYDDADFYQLLLKELVYQRTVDGGAVPSGVVPTVSFTAVKEAKVRKQVDRKASKGRKMRFTVHEKLQDLMAPEDRRSWEADAIDRFFGTLFGRKLALDEDESTGDEDPVGKEEEQGLRLFRD